MNDNVTQHSEPETAVTPETETDTGTNQFETPAVPVSVAPKSREPKHTVIIVLLVLILIGLVLGFGVIIYYQSTQKDQVTPTPTPSVTIQATATPTPLLATGTPTDTPIVTVPAVLEAPGRIKITSVAAIQNIPAAGATIVITGQIKDFFEGLLNYRLLGGNGGTLLSGSVTASGDNYGQFADFSKTVTVPPIPSTAGNPGKWEFYDVSMEDGAETVLLTVPVEFN